jgi:hypothetical protein
MNVRGPALQVLALIITCSMFGAVAFCSRAASRRVLGALVGGLLLIPMIMFYDAVAARLGWWHYSPVISGPAPLAWYVAAALWYGAALGLVGWRVIRRFGRAGLVIFLIGFALLGTTRDYLYSITTRLIVIASGPLPLIADLFAYASGAVVVQLCMYWVTGPRSDPLARSAPKASGS